MKRVNITLPPILYLFAKRNDINLSNFIQNQIKERMNKMKGYCDLRSILSFLLKLIDQNEDYIIDQITNIGPSAHLIYESIMYLNTYLRCNDDFTPIHIGDREVHSSSQCAYLLELVLSKDGLNIKREDKFGSLTFSAYFLSLFSIFINYCLEKDIPLSMKKNLNNIILILTDLKVGITKNA